MSFVQYFIDLEQKLEGFFREVRVGFPEGLKQYLMSVGNDVVVWMSTNYMTVLFVLAVTALVAMSYKMYRIHKRAHYLIDRNISLQHDYDYSLSEYTILSSQYKCYRADMSDYLSETMSALNETKSKNLDLQDEVDTLLADKDYFSERLSDSEQVIYDLEDRLYSSREALDEAQENIDDLENQVSTLKDIRIALSEELDEAQEELTRLNSIIDNYAALVHELDNLEQ